MPLTRTAGRTAVAVLLAAGLLAACGDDDPDDEAAGTTTEAAEEEEANAAEEPTSSLDDASDGGLEDGVLEVHLVDYAFEQLPESVPAGTRLTVVNDSEAELHELIAFPLPGEEERSVDELAALPMEVLEGLFTGPPTTVLLAPPGGEQIDAVGDGTLAEAGRYVLMCFIPTGVDPEEYLNAPETEEGPPDIPGAGPPHFTQGMYAELVVE